MIHRPSTARWVRRATASALAAAAGVTLGGCAPARAGDALPPAPVAATDAPSTDAHASAAAAVLKQVEAAATDHRTLTARVRMRSIQDLLDDETTRFGDLAWRRACDDTPACFAVHFDRLKPLDGALEAIDRRYIYDGHWLLDLDGRARTAARRELNTGNDGGELSLGDGPFLLPMNLKAQRVLATFDAALAAPDERTDPEGEPTDHLVLTPKPQAGVDAAQLDLWFDQATRLPRRVVSEQADGDRTVVDLFEVQVNPKLPDDRFDTALPDTPGWELQTVPAENR